MITITYTLLNVESYCPPPLKWNDNLDWQLLAHSGKTHLDTVYLEVVTRIKICSYNLHRLEAGATSARWWRAIPFNSSQSPSQALTAPREINHPQENLFQPFLKIYFGYVSP